MITAALMVPAPAESTLVTPSATLPLRSTALRVEAGGGIARVVLEQRFRNEHPDPLAVSYRFALPAEAAVSGFAFTVGERRIEGVVEKRLAARERFEQAIAQGKTAALLEQERSSLFTQELGNVPAGAEVRCEVTLDQRLRWNDEGGWEWRFPLASAPRYLGGPGRVEDAAELALEVAEALAPRASLRLVIADARAVGARPASPSHSITVSDAEVGLAEAALDRDVVVLWRVATLEPSLRARGERGGPRAKAHADVHALLTLVPPLAEAQMRPVARDLIVLLDTSGSMQGAPLDQARRVASALIDGLCEHDQLELIEFSTKPRRFGKAALRATQANKRAALEWLGKLRASGGTEMRDGVLEALSPLRAEAQRQVVLITDGLIGFEDEIMAAIHDHLPPGSRVHAVGVGSSVNRSLTGPAARAGRGVEVVIGLEDDAERAAARIRARTEQPIVVDVQGSGDALLEVAPACIPDLYAGAPVLVSARVRPAGGELVVTGRTASGTWEQRVRVEVEQGSEGSEGSGVLATLFGREAVEDAEMRLAAGASRDEIDARVEALGLSYRIATRLTSWVAIDERASVDPRAPTRRETVPQALPYGMSIEGLGLRPPVLAAGPAAMPMARFALAAPMGVMPEAPREAPPEARGEARSWASMPKRAEAPEAKRGGVFSRALEAVLGAGRFSSTTTTTERVRGRVTKRKRDTIVIHLEVLEAFDWDDAALAAASVVLELDDGTSVEAEVVVAQTTRAARLLPGQHAKLTLQLDRELTATARVVHIAELGLDIPLT